MQKPYYENLHISLLHPFSWRMFRKNVMFFFQFWTFCPNDKKQNGYERLQPPSPSFENFRIQRVTIWRVLTRQIQTTTLCRFVVVVQCTRSISTFDYLVVLGELYCCRDCAEGRGNAECRCCNFFSRNFLKNNPVLKKTMLTLLCIIFQWYI